MEICREETWWHLACLLDFSPEEWNSDVSSLGFMPAHKSTSDKSGQLRTTWESQASGAFYLNEGFGGYPRPPLSALILMRGQQIEKWLRLSLRPTEIRDLCGPPARQPSLYLEI